jgi:hypothetical protein
MGGVSADTSEDLVAIPVLFVYLTLVAELTRETCWGKPRRW